MMSHIANSIPLRGVGKVLMQSYKVSDLTNVCITSTSKGTGRDAVSQPLACKCGAVL